MLPFTKDIIRSARKANLYTFLLHHHADKFLQEGHSLRLKTNHSISIREGYSGYTDFSTSETGNSIDFLEKYLDYSFFEAVDLLSRSTSDTSTRRHFSRNETHPPPDAILSPLPARAAGFPDDAICYLQNRGIPAWLSKKLFMDDLLYMEKTTRNLVFLSRKKDFYELRGTVKGSCFHSCKKVEPNRCWSFRSGPHPSHAMICEAAIDALSLYVLRLMDGTEDGCTLYCGIAGVCNQKAIDRVRGYLPVTIATDNDEAGEQCRKRNPNDHFLIPKHKDWNDDLCALLGLSNTNHA